MIQSTNNAQQALMYEVDVSDDGRIEVQVPFAAGARVVVFVVPEPEESFRDLLSASESAFSFWDNLYDDEDWNDA